MDKYKNAVCPKSYFLKKNSKYEILNHWIIYILVLFSLLGTALGRFSQCFFFFCFFLVCRPTRVTEIFTRSPHHKKASYGPEYRFDSSQVKQDLISSIINFVYELPHELPNDLRLRILGATADVKGNHQCQQRWCENRCSEYRCNVIIGALKALFRL